MYPYLLQINPSLQDSINYTPTGSVEQLTQNLSVWDLTLKGGWIMAVLALLSILGIYLFISKVIELRMATREDRSFLDRIKDYVTTGRTDAAISLCEHTNTPSSRVIARLLTRCERSMNDKIAVVENAGSVEAGRLQKGMPLLATIVAAAPMIGFLGTVTGMVRAFFDMANSSNALDVSVLSSGIYEALVTTVGGLIVGIIMLFAYNYLVARINNVLNSVEEKALNMIDFLQDAPEATPRTHS